MRNGGFTWVIPGSLPELIVSNCVKRPSFFQQMHPFYCFKPQWWFSPQLGVVELRFGGWDLVRGVLGLGSKYTKS